MNKIFDNYKMMMKKTFLLALLLVGSMAMLKAQSVKGGLGSLSPTHNDQFFIGKTVTVDLSTGGIVKLTATPDYGGEKEYDISASALTLDLSDEAVEPIKVICPDESKPKYNVGTHVAGSALNFSNTEQNMKAYVATAVDGINGTITLAETEAIKNGDSFVIRADEAGWYCIPIGGSANYETNLFKGNAKAATSLNPANTYYALHKSGKFAKVNTASVLSVPAGRAYLEITGSALANFLEFVFDGETTAIESVFNTAKPAAEAIVDAPAYNLAGQRVSTKSKGIIIIKGKKFMYNK